MFLPVITSCIVSNELDASQMKNKFNSFSKKKSSAKDYYRLISKENLIKNIRQSIPFSNTTENQPK